MGESKSAACEDGTVRVWLGVREVDMEHVDWCSADILESTHEGSGNSRCPRWCCIGSGRGLYTQSGFLARTQLLHGTFLSQRIFRFLHKIQELSSQSQP